MNEIHLIGGGTVPMKNHSTEAMTFTVGGGWGDRITINEWPKRDNENLASVYGHKNPIPRIGDTLRVPCKSGKVMLCKFVDVRPCGDPADMFFADVEGIGYESKLSVNGEELKRKS